MCKGLSIDDVGVSRDTVSQEIRPGAGFETGDSVKEKPGGATVVRLRNGMAIDPAPKKNLENHPTAGVLCSIRKSLRSSHEELNISPKNMTSKAFVRTTRPRFYALVLNQYVLMKTCQ